MNKSLILLYSIYREKNTQGFHFALVFAFRLRFAFANSGFKHRLVCVRSAFAQHLLTVEVGK